MINLKVDTELADHAPSMYAREKTTFWTNVRRLGFAKRVVDKRTLEPPK